MVYPLTHFRRIVLAPLDASFENVEVDPPGNRQESKDSAKVHLCSDCGATLKSAKTLRQHCVLVHNKSAPYKCDICDRGFPSNQKWLDHLTLHHKAKRHQCHDCKETFRYQWSLRRHQKNAHPK